MEGIIAQKVAPIIKCMVLFLLIFTAKVLTSRPQESQESKNIIQHVKPAYYVRTFTKYHHRRTIQWNALQDVNTYWPVTQDHAKSIIKRSVVQQNGFVEKAFNIPILSQYSPEGNRDNIIGPIKKSPTSLKNKNSLTKEIKIFKVKAAMVVTDPPTTFSPGISCLFHNVALSAAPSYNEESNVQHVVENENFESPGSISEKVLDNGEKVLVEQCTKPQATCYTLWHLDDDGNKTVLGQGCWRSSSKQDNCNKCTSVTSLLPGTKFCCCTTSYCNADFLSLREEIVTPKAEPAKDQVKHRANYSNIVTAAILALVAILVLVVAFKKIYCAKPEVTNKDDSSDGTDVEKGGIMSSGPDSLATGLLCVDNLTLVEHIGQGKFGTVWRGSLGANPVAVKLYTHVGAWQKELSIYSMPHLAHPNILKYYGCDSRITLTGGCGREHLIVLELCPSTLRSRLEAAPLSWAEFAQLSHGLASALAHLHSSNGSKPCVVHRDVNSNNVLISMDGQARLADLGLARPVLRSQPSSVIEAGTLRYLAPEALEGALDLSGARAALCAVDVFALGLVLWEMLWRTKGAHPGPVPPYTPPYQHLGLPNRPTLAQMQSLVSRKKARPPLPKGPVAEARALKIATETCDECWDHDAEARLTAVCVEERMSELKQMLVTSGPVIHDNNLHPHLSDLKVPSPPETDKNSNCLAQNCDVNTPLLYSQPHIGRNPCIERNTHTTQTHNIELIHKSLKDITVPIVEGPRIQNIDQNCLSVARVTHNRLHLNENSDRFNEIRSYQRPLEYVPNDVTFHDELRGPKQTNLLHDIKVEKPKWGIRKFFERKLQRNANPLETEVKLVQEPLNGCSTECGRFKTSIINDHPSSESFTLAADIGICNHDGNPYDCVGPCLSPPNRTLSPTMLKESDMNKENKVFAFKEMPSRNREDNDSKPPNQIFSVIVPKAKPYEYARSHQVRSNSLCGSSESLNKQSLKTSISSQSMVKSMGHSESEDSTVKKRLSCDNKIISNTSNSGKSSRTSINLELQYINNDPEIFNENISPFDINSDCSSSEDEHLMLLSENDGSKITMQTVTKVTENDKTKQNEVLKEASQPKPDFCFNTFHNKYSNLDNEFSYPNDKENLVVQTYSVDNPVYLATVNGEINTTEFKYLNTPLKVEEKPNSPKPSLKSLSMTRQHSLEQVSEIFSSAENVPLRHPATRVKTPGDLPAAVRRARAQRGHASGRNRLSLYDDRVMFGNSL